MEFATNPHDGTRIAYRHTAATGDTAQTATPVVLVHGTALSQAIWRGFGYLKALGAERPVITLDLRGHGRSGTPHRPADYDMARFVDDVLAVLDALALDRVHYLGYSLGARVGFSLAAAHPERLASFVSVAGAPGTGVGTFDKVFFTGSIEALERGGMAGFLAEWERASGSPVDPMTRTAFLANDAPALAAYMRETERQPTVPDAAISRFPMPVQLLAGTRDRPRLRAAENVKAALPGAELVLLDGATHADTPRHPDALPAIRAFLART
ncbi:alpha/beta fold hydrolase [Herbiconiux sp. P18]|uniref:alpha/beta fold hydrolase n=1 Tax=Herbiconiux liangxiaofengii TaxID=3342795 RepID=UPI0035B932CA